MEISNLKSIGLTENEIKIYLLLLKSGSITAYEISQKTGIYRAHVYDKLEQLIKKGLVTHVYKGAKKYVSIQPSAVDFSSSMTISEKSSFLNWHVCMTEETTS